MADMKTGIFAKNVQKRLNRAQEKVRGGEGGGCRGEAAWPRGGRSGAEGSRLQRELRGYLAAIKGDFLCSKLRVGFYVNTFKNVSSLEAKFHKEIALELFTILKKLDDSGPLRIAKTPSPPEEVSPLPSPTASPNHMLAPASPAPARPKSPTQLRKGPPVPPLPKLTPTKELQQENIINLFDDNFVPEINVTTPSQNEIPETKKEESLLDLDFDPFKPEVVSTGVTHSPMSQVSLLLRQAQHKNAKPCVSSPFILQVVSAADGAVAVEDSVVVAAGAGEGAAPTEQEAAADGDKPQGEEKEVDVSQEKVSSIPSVVIEPASNNEGEGEEHDVIMNESKDAAAEMGTQGTDSETSQVGSEQKATEEIQTAPSQDQPVSAGDTASDMPPGFLFKVEVLHDFEAANSDELNLKRGDIVLVIPSETTADQGLGGWILRSEIAKCSALNEEHFLKYV
uniref:SH3 domain-containing protein n=1 Tax=Pavo cristatus TaxID=9049 RepID=A0A8C9FYK3_PAVCR